MKEVGAHAAWLDLSKCGQCEDVCGLSLSTCKSLLRPGLYLEHMRRLTTYGVRDVGLSGRANTWFV